MADIPIQVQYRHTGEDDLVWLKRISQSIQFEFQNALAGLGELTASRMGEIIQESIKRPPNTGKLAMSITSEILNSTGGLSIGIGNIGKMNSEAPYWEVLNDGGYLPPPAVGFFGDGNAPMAGKGGEKWTDDPGAFPMTPKKVTEPVNYIEKADAELVKHIKEQLNKLLGARGTFMNSDIT